MINEVATGAQDKKPIKSFNEGYEMSVWRMVMKYVDEEKRTNGEVAYVVGDMSNLVVGIMKFYEEKRT